LLDWVLESGRGHTGWSANPYGALAKSLNHLAWLTQVVDP